MSDYSTEGTDMDLLKQARDQGITLFTVITGIIAIVWAASELSSDVEHMAGRLEVVNRKVDHVNTDVTDIKMKVNTLDNDLKHAKDDIDRVRTDVQLTRSQMITTGRNIREIKKEVTGNNVNSPIPLNGVGAYGRTFE